MPGVPTVCNREGEGDMKNDACGNCGKNIDDHTIEESVACLRTLTPGNREEDAQ